MSSETSNSLSIRPGEDALRKMRIRHVVVASGDAHPSAANGVHNVARHLKQEQRAAGHEADILLLHQAKRWSTSNDDEGSISVGLGGLSVRGRTVRLRRDVLDAVLAGTGDDTVFHIHGGREPLLIGFTRVLRRRRLRYVMTIHGRFSHVYDGDGACLRPLTSFYLQWCERSMLTGAAFVQALSADERRVIRRVAPNAAIQVVGNGAYSSRLDDIPMAPSQRSRSACYPHFVFCGRYAIHHKGLDLLLEGFAFYHHGGGTGYLTLIGSGPARDELMSMARRLKIANAVTIRGPLFGKERDAVLNGGDFFVMASRYEGVPLAALEAGLLGLPLLLTAPTGLHIAVEGQGAGIPIAALSAVAVSDGMMRAAALSAVEWDRQRQAAFRFVVSAGNWTGIAARLCSLYAQSGQTHPCGDGTTP